MRKPNRVEQIIQAAAALLRQKLIQRIVEASAAVLLEARGEYYYEEITVKRWVLGPGGRSGNCEICIENADEGWIDMDATWLSSDGDDIDEPPAHPHCECTAEFKDTRKRVYT